MGTVGLVLAAVLVLAATGMARADFVLSGDLHLDVTTWHTTGYLYDTSTADLLQGGYIESAYVNDEALLRVLEYGSGPPGVLNTPISVYHLYAYDASAVQVSNGWVYRLYAYDTSAVALSGGEVEILYAYGTRAVDITGGKVNWLYAPDVRPYGPERLNISGGTVNNLRLLFLVEGSETFSFSGLVSDLGPHGILASEGTVTNLCVNRIDAYNTSTVDISGGDVYSLNAYDTSTVNFSGGSVCCLNADDTSAVNFSGGSVTNSLSAGGTSAVDISGGSVTKLSAGYNSTLNISGGEVSSLSAFVRVNGPERVNISGGTVNDLSVGFRVEESDTFSFSGLDSVADLAPHGILASDGTVTNFAGVSGIRAYDSSVVDFLDGSVTTLAANDNSALNVSGGEVAKHLYAYDTSAVDISGGKVTYLYTYDTSAVHISGGEVGRINVYGLRPYGPERLNISGGTVNGMYIWFRVEGSETFSYSIDSVADLLPHGILASEGIVTNFSVDIDIQDSGIVYLTGGLVRDARAYGSSTVNFSGGSVGALYAYGTSALNVSGGEAHALVVHDTSAVDLSGGKVKTIYAYGTSTVDISSGEVGLLYAYETNAVNISGGSVFQQLNAYKTSAVEITGGSVSSLLARDSSTVDFTAGSVSRLNAWEKSSVHISGGENISLLFARDSSTIAISGGSVSNLNAYDNNIVAISGGSVGQLSASGTSALDISGAAVLTDISAWDSTTIAMSGGSVSSLIVYNVRLFGPERVNISGGTVNTLGVSFRIEGGETFSFSGFDSVADLAPHGILASEGTVANFCVSGLDVFADSILDMTGGSVESLSSYDSSVVNLFGGTVGVAPGHSLYAYDSSTANLFGGSVSAVYAYDTSTVAFVAQDFQFGEGLSLDGNRVLGTGVLSGEWFDGTAWTITIAQNDSTASIRATPEPATLSLLAVGVGAVYFKRSRR